MVTEYAFDTKPEAAVQGDHASVESKDLATKFMQPQ